MEAHMIEIVISIKNQYVELISNKTKNHEFRNYIPKKGVDRLWIYTSSPVKKIEYVADIDYIAKQPETIDEYGIGNREFNNLSSNYCYAYHIKSLYKLQNPIDIETLKKDFNFSPPQSYFYLENNMKLNDHFKKVKLNKIL
jgi:predicted transcriptional regulator